MMYNVCYELQNGTLLLYERNGASGSLKPLRYLGSMFCSLSVPALVGKGPEDREYQILEEAIRAILEHAPHRIHTPRELEYVAYRLEEDSHISPLMGKYKTGQR